MIIKQIFTEPETEVKWYFDSTEEIVIVYNHNQLATWTQARQLHKCICVEDNHQVIGSAPVDISCMASWLVAS